MSSSSLEQRTEKERGRDREPCDHVKRWSDKRCTSPCFYTLELTKIQKPKRKLRILPKKKKRRNSNCCAPQATVWISDSVKKKGESEENEYWQELSQQPVQNGKGERAAFCRALLLNLVLRDNDREARASPMNG